MWKSLADFSVQNFAQWSVQDEAFGTSPSPAGDFVVGNLSPAGSYSPVRARRQQRIGLAAIRRSAPLADV